MQKTYQIGEIMRRWGPDFVAKKRPHPVVRKAIRDISICRTPRLGGRKIECLTCGHEHYLYNSCGNRNCPLCQSIKKEIWVDKIAQTLLPVSHSHVVFTLPHELNNLLIFNQKELYNSLFGAAWRSIRVLCADEKRGIGAHPGMVSMLHT